MVRASLTLLSGTKDAPLSVTVQAVAGKGEARGVVARQRGVSLFRFGTKSVKAAAGAFVGGVLGGTPRLLLPMAFNRRHSISPSFVLRVELPPPSFKWCWLVVWAKALFERTHA